MPRMTIEAPHRLGAAEAKLRIQGLLGDVKGEFGDRVADLKETWTGDRADFSFRAMGFAIAGTLEVEADRVRLSGTYPLAAVPFRGRIEQVIRSRAEALLNDQSAGGTTPDQ